MVIKIVECDWIASESEALDPASKKHAWEEREDFEKEVITSLRFTPDRLWAAKDLKPGTL